MEFGHVSEEVSDRFIEKLDRAWSLILDQYFDFAVNIASKEGEGMSIFKMKDKPPSLSGSVHEKEPSDNCSAPSKKEPNCDFFYTEKGGVLWNAVMDATPSTEKSKFVDKYDHNSMLMICIQIPTNSMNGETSGNVRLFDIDTKKEIICVNSSEGSKSSQKTTKPITLRKRESKKE